MRYLESDKSSSPKSGSATSDKTKTSSSTGTTSSTGTSSSIPRLFSESTLARSFFDMDSGEVLDIENFVSRRGYDSSRSIELTDCESAKQKQKQIVIGRGYFIAEKKQSAMANKDEDDGMIFNPEITANSDQQGSAFRRITLKPSELHF
ncbi:MAG: hypothetical protein MHMPM18_004150 [Marteilia pararefringens]